MDLDDLRTRIDEIDREIVRLLRQRAEVATKIGEAKRSRGLPVFDPAREEKVLQKVTAGEIDPLDKSALRAIFTEIMSACRAIEEPVTVAYLGPEYTFSHLAAIARFGRAAKYLECQSVSDVFHAVEHGQAHVGVVPVENSLSGSVSETLDRLLRSDLQVVGEHYQRIEHSLLSKGRLEDIRTVYSHPHALAQCREWLTANLPAAELVPAASTAAAAKAAAQAGEAAAAIATAAAAEAYGLNVLARGIEDDPRNRTRFFIIGRQPTAPTGKDKTSLVFATPHRAGALHEALTSLRIYGINMTMIQSRPAGGRLWTYVFFVDIEGHQQDETVARALEDLAGRTSHLAVLGSYPAAENGED